MRVCIVAEGCYPYVVGGVSQWIHGLIHSYPEQEFVILAIVADRSLRGKYVYELPENVSEIHELYLNDSDWSAGKNRKKMRMNRKTYQALVHLMLGQKVQWELLFDYFQKAGRSLNDVLMGEDFLNAVTEYYCSQYSQVLKMGIPKADVYHCTSTGYAGVLGSLAKHIHGGRLLISEHGVYTREREEELIKAKWVQGIYKNIWIDQFKKMSALAYDKADLVVGLYQHARELQIELGCPAEKHRIVPNGIRVEQFQHIPGKREEDGDKINIGSVLRVAPIKDVMTLIQAFGFAKEKEPRLKLWIMGDWAEEEDYAKNCFEQVRIMGIPDVEFTGRIDVHEYYGRMDMTILTSISEGQPLTISTDVGNCRGLILGENDDFGAAGIVTRIMHVEEIANAVLRLARDESLRRRMGENGYRRVVERYQFVHMQEAYKSIYQKFADELQIPLAEKERK